VLYAVILFCSLATSPVDCDEVSASRWERVPGGNSLLFRCFANAEIWAAEHGLAPQKGEYSKVRCSAHEFGPRIG
jgi:hypothetical protein